MAEINSGVLYAKMAKIMGEISRLPKDAKTKSGPSYNFTSDSAVADLVRGKLAENNIGFFAEMYDCQQEPITSANGGGGYHTVVFLRFTFACGDSGAVVVREWRGESNDYGDKGINKASTLGEKFFLLKTFVMSTGEAEDDPDTHNVPRKPSQKPAAPAKQTPPADDIDAALGRVKLNGDADVLRSLMSSRKQFDAEKWEDLRPFFLDAGLAKNEFEADARLRKVLGVMNPDGTYNTEAPMSEVIAAQKEAKFTVAVLATGFKKRAETPAADKVQA